MPRTVLAVAVALALGACSGREDLSALSEPPAFLVGEFIDDYGSRYSIRPDVWTHHPHASYNVVAWYIDDQFAVARNDPENPGDGNLWTRIDWVQLDGSDEYRWAYCYSTYDAATQAEAVAAVPAVRATPRTGCGGFPFSRMKRASRTSASLDSNN
ncbi:MAG: hypothetical protein ACR2QM_18075 [Longimicrobiales bacterium]